MRNGIGVCHYANKEIYDGEWFDDMKNGHGKVKKKPNRKLLLR